MIRRVSSIVTRWLTIYLLKNLKYVSPKKEIKPKTYQLNPEQTLFLGGLGRFDFVAGDKQGFTAYFDNELKLHRTKLQGASEFYDKHVGSLLVPPIGKEKESFPPWSSMNLPLRIRQISSSLVWVGFASVDLPA